ncbi:hypothetical protein Tco_0169927 [Tanacetum coccineum]
MSSNSDDIQAAGSDTRPPMLDRTDYESWSQRIRLYCRGKENGVYILQSIDQGPFQLGVTRDTLGTTPEGGVLLGPERARTYDDLNDNEKKRFDADVRATNIVLQGLPKDIYKLINHNIEAKAIWDNVKMLLAGSELTKEDRESQLYDEFERFKMLPGENINEYYVRFHKLVNDMRNIRMTMPNIQLNSKFVNNMSPEWDRFVIVVKLNKGSVNAVRHKLMPIVPVTAAEGKKPVESDGFAEIIEFLKTSSVHYALIVNPILYTSCIEQFWATTKVQIVNGVRQLQALVDKKRVIVTESSIWRDLHLDDAEGTDCLPTDTIFEELAHMGAKSTAWNEFSCSMASLIICLATNHKFNMSMYIFDAMVKHLDGGVKFLMYPYFLQVFINQQLGDMSTHKKIFVNFFHTKKVFANMKRVGKDFSGRITPLFDTMMVQASKEVGEDLDHPTDSTQVPILDQPSTSSKPKKKQPSKKTQRQEAEVSQDEIEHEESVPTPSNDPQPSGEDSIQLTDLMVLCTKLQTQVLDLEKVKRKF